MKKINLKISLIAIFVLSFISFSVGATVTFYTNEDEWTANVQNIETFDIADRTNLAKANEIDSPPANGDNLGSILTFESANTGLSMSFNLKTLQSGAPWMYKEYPYGWPLAPGGSFDGYEDDDWEVNILSGASVTAFGFKLLDSGNVEGEQFAIYGANGVLLGSTTDIPTGSSFFGVISDEPILRIYFDEDPGGDDIGIDGFKFGVVPEPATLSLVGIGIFGFVRKR